MILALHAPDAKGQARADRTVILVAHRLSTLVDADRILVFDNGRIPEDGTYGELVFRGGVFAELVRCASSITEEPSPPEAPAPAERPRHAHHEAQEGPPPEFQPEAPAPAPASA